MDEDELNRIEKRINTLQNAVAANHNLLCTEVESLARDIGTILEWFHARSYHMTGGLMDEEIAAAYSRITREGGDK